MDEGSALSSRGILWLLALAAASLNHPPASDRLDRGKSETEPEATLVLHISEAPDGWEGPLRVVVRQENGTNFTTQRFYDTLLPNSTTEITVEADAEFVVYLTSDASTGQSCFVYQDQLGPLQLAAGERLEIDADLLDAVAADFQLVGPSPALLDGLEIGCYLYARPTDDQFVELRRAIVKLGSDGRFQAWAPPGAKAHFAAWIVPTRSAQLSTSQVVFRNRIEPHRWVKLQPGTTIPLEPSAEIIGVESADAGEFRLDAREGATVHVSGEASRQLCLRRDFDDLQWLYMSTFSNKVVLFRREDLIERAADLFTMDPELAVQPARLRVLDAADGFAVKIHYEASGRQTPSRLLRPDGYWISRSLIPEPILVTPRNGTGPIQRVELQAGETSELRLNAEPYQEWVGQIENWRESWDRSGVFIPVLQRHARVRGDGSFRIDLPANGPPPGAEVSMKCRGVIGEVRAQIASMDVEQRQLSVRIQGGDIETVSLRALVGPGRATPSKLRLQSLEPSYGEAVLPGTGGEFSRVAGQNVRCAIRGDGRAVLGFCHLPADRSEAEVELASREIQIRLDAPVRHLWVGVEPADGGGEPWGKFQVKRARVLTRVSIPADTRRLHLSGRFDKTTVIELSAEVDQYRVRWTH